MPFNFIIITAYMPQPVGSASYMPYPGGSFPLSSGGYGSYPPYPPSTTTSYPPYPPTTNQSFLPYPAYPPYPSGFGGAPSTPSNICTGTGTIKDEHIRESLLTAIEEKLMRRMKEQFQQNQAEMETLKRTQEELKQGKAKLDSILSRLEKEQVGSYLYMANSVNP